jgi:5-methylcytosine-specific restriction endonuclease McrA
MNNKKLIRENFRNAVFTRDNFTCAFCSETNNLDAHHITDRNEMPNSGYIIENGVRNTINLQKSIIPVKKHKQFMDFIQMIYIKKLVPRMN